jgi:hypothetical protein
LVDLLALSEADKAGPEEKGSLKKEWAATDDTAEML